jgi:hypothetical protein
LLKVSLNTINPPISPVILVSINIKKKKTQKNLKDEQHGPHQKTWDEPRCLQKVSSSCFL